MLGILGILDSESLNTDHYNSTHKYIFSLMASLLASRIIYNENIEKIQNQEALEIEAKHL